MTRFKADYAHTKLGFLNLDAFVEKLIVKSEVAVDAEVEVGAEVELTLLLSTHRLAE